MAQILDQYGRPIERQVLAEQQTARLASRRRTWEDHPATGLTPAKLAGILRRAEQGDLIAQHEMMRDIEERDSHIQTCLSTRKGALLGLDWDIVPPPDATKSEIEDAEWLKGMLEMLDFEALLLDMLDAIAHGFAALELDWQRIDGMRLPVPVWRPQTWFTTDRDDPNQLMLNLGGKPEPLWSFGWIIHTPRSRSGYLARRGLGRTLAWLFMFWAFAWRDWAEFLEVYGLPMRLGRYDSGIADEDKATLLQAVRDIGHSAAGIIPRSMEIQFQAAAAGTHEPFQAMAEQANQEKSKVILGQTLTTQADGKTSTHALGTVHDGVFWTRIVPSDARQAARTLRTQLLWPMLAVNRPGAMFSRCPHLVFDLGESEDLKTFASSLPNLVDLGVEIEEEWVREKLRIPTPKEGAKLLTRRRPAPTKPPEPSTGAAALTSLAALATAPAEAPDTPQVQLARLLQEAHLGGVLAPLSSLLREATSLEDLRDRVMEAYPEMNASQFQDVMALALEAADLAGRYEADHGQ